MNIIISGDFFVSDDYQNIKLFDANIVDLFNSANCRIVNLEAPLVITNAAKKILKSGPHLKSSPSTTIPFLKELKIDLATLANNHILDYGVIGLTDTLKALKENNIDYVGIGMNKADAQKNHIIHSTNTKIAIVNIAENEWANAGDNTPGANPMDVIDNIRQIELAKSEADIVILVIHGGHGHYHYPSPRMVKQYRFYADAGASVIICHHSHCISGYEIYKKVPIFYGLGNFIFTMPSRYDSWYSGLMLSLKISSDLSIDFEIFPTRSNKSTYRTELLDGQEREEVLSKIIYYNEIIANNDLLNLEWEQFLKRWEKHYLRPFALTDRFPNKYVRAAFSKLNIDRYTINKENVKELLSLLRCEAHVDATKEILLDYLYRKTKKK